MTKNLWEQKGNHTCEICKKGFAQVYSDVKDGKYVTACWGCLYKKQLSTVYIAFYCGGSILCILSNKRKIYDKIYVQM